MPVVLTTGLNRNKDSEYHHLEKILNSREASGFSNAIGFINFIKITNRKGLISSSLFFVPIIKFPFYFFSDMDFVRLVCFFAVDDFL